MNKEKIMAMIFGTITTLIFLLYFFVYVIPFIPSLARIFLYVK